MADQNQFGRMPDANPGKSGPGGLSCDQWEALLADMLDGLLPPQDTGAFAAHGAACPGCGDLLAHAKQGREWLIYLHEEPEIPAGLVGRIIEKTTGAGTIPVVVIAGAGQAPGAAAAAIPWRRSFHETRLLMTVAMAFFSIMVTLNIAGVRMGGLRLADLRPSMIGNTLSRQFYGARASVVRFYDNMRFVYQMESRIRELRQDTGTTPQKQTPEKQEPSKKGDQDGQVNPPPGSGLRAQGAGLTSRTTVGTEATILNPWATHGAGPRRFVEDAGKEGRSLA